jgi:hypothetical protein
MIMRPFIAMLSLLFLVTSVVFGRGQEPEDEVAPEPLTGTEFAAQADSDGDGAVS